jgi:hypothetical protein
MTPNLKEAHMAGTGKAKATSNSLDAEEELRQEMGLRQEERLTGERIEQQDLNQGMDTGTHASTHLGVNWGPSYRVRHEIEQGFPTKNLIEARAYELYLQRGCEHGHEVEDWLIAEKEVKER